MTSVPRRKPAATTVDQPDVGALVKVFARFRGHKNAEVAAKAAAEQLRDEELMPALVKYGQAHGEKGAHLAIDLPEEVDGFVRLVRRANTSTFVNLDRGEALATTGGFLNQVQDGVLSFAVKGPPDVVQPLFVWLTDRLNEWSEENETALLVPVYEERFSQERLMAYHQLHRDEETAKATAKSRGKRKAGTVLSEADIDSLMDTETTYAFHPERR